MIRVNSSNIYALLLIESQNKGYSEYLCQVLKFISQKCSFRVSTYLLHIKQTKQFINQLHIMMLERYRFSVLIVLLAIFSSCDIINPGNKDSSIKTNTVQSEKAIGIAGKDMLRTDDGVLLLGNATKDYEKPDQMYLAELDQQGNILWEQIYDDGRFRNPEAMIKTSDGNILVTGLGWSNNTLDGNLYVGKLSPRGTVLWEDTYRFKYDDSGFGGNTGLSAVEVEDGYIIGGKGVSSAGGSGTTTSMVTKVDYEGQLQWSESISEYEVEWIHNLLYDPESGDLFAALNYANDEDIFRINSAVEINNKESSKGIAYLGDVTFGDMIKNESGSYIAVGQENSTFFQVAFDREGEQIWSNTLNEFEYQSATKIIEPTNSSFYTLGTVRDSTDNTDIYIVNSFTDGSINWKQRFGKDDDWEQPVDLVSFGGGNLGVITNYQHDGFYDIKFWQISQSATQ